MRTNNCPQIYLYFVEIKEVSEYKDAYVLSENHHTNIMTEIVYMSVTLGLGVHTVHLIHYI